MMNENVNHIAMLLLGIFGQGKRVFIDLKIFNEVSRF